jgi:hypothetical protein
MLIKTHLLKIWNWASNQAVPTNTGAEHQWKLSCLVSEDYLQSQIACVCIQAQNHTGWTMQLLWEWPDFCNWMVKEIMQVKA